MKEEMWFSQEELQLLFAACMSYGERLSKIAKKIPYEQAAVYGIGQVHGLADRAKDSWNLADKISQYIREAKENE